MTKEFDSIRNSSQIDNFMAGTSQAARRQGAGTNSETTENKGPTARVGSLPAKSGK